MRFGIRPGRWIGQGSRLQRYKGHEFLLRAVAAYGGGRRVRP
jgi:hypothetical protein